VGRPSQTYAQPKPDIRPAQARPHLEEGRPVDAAVRPQHPAAELRPLHHSQLPQRRRHPADAGGTLGRPWQDAALPRYGRGGCGVVAGEHLDADAGRLAGGDGGGRLRPQRVLQPGNCQLRSRQGREGGSAGLAGRRGRGGGRQRGLAVPRRAVPAGCLQATRPRWRHGATQSSTERCSRQGARRAAGAGEQEGKEERRKAHQGQVLLQVERNAHAIVPAVVGIKAAGQEGRK
jgi:hypothetical protein